MIIAIDGPAASGKGTLARRIAAHYRLRLLDTGLLYRAVGRELIRRGLKADDTWAAVALARTLDDRLLDDPELRSDAAGEAASIVARIPAVRAALLAYQRAFAAMPPGAVLDGRDIGTVVVPDAIAKIYVYAGLEERARRRHLELTARGETISQDEVRRQIAARDARDMSRSAAPLAAAADAYLLDTSELDIEAAFKSAVTFIDGKAG